MSFGTKLALLILGVMIALSVVYAICAYWEWNIRMADKAAERSRNERERKRAVSEKLPKSEYQMSRFM